MSVEAVTTDTPGVADLVAELDEELSGAGYAADEMFGYSLHQLADSRVSLVAARRDGVPVGIGGVELQGEDAELKRFYVRPAHRGHGVADEVLAALVEVARSAGVARLRLETGIEQHAAIAFYRRNGFEPIPRFGPYVDSASSVCMQREL